MMFRNATLDELDLADVEVWREGLSLRSGLCVVGGKTSSGLTTTLHASARELERSGRRVGFVCSAADWPGHDCDGFDPADRTHGGVIASAIRAALETGCDAIVVSLDDPNALMWSAAASLGCLVVAEVHARPSVQFVRDRLVDMYAPAIDVVRCVMAQELLGGGVPRTMRSEAALCDGWKDVARTTVPDGRLPSIEANKKRDIPLIGTTS